jgi:hypothetical protein
MTTTCLRVDICSFRTATPPPRGRRRVHAMTPAPSQLPRAAVPALHQRGSALSAAPRASGRTGTSIRTNRGGEVRVFVGRRRTARNRLQYTHYSCSVFVETQSAAKDREQWHVLSRQRWRYVVSERLTLQAYGEQAFHCRAS